MRVVLRGYANRRDVIRVYHATQHARLNTEKNKMAVCVKQLDEADKKGEEFSSLQCVKPEGNMITEGTLSPNPRSSWVFIK